jgi:hypothetical protein
MKTSGRCEIISLAATMYFHICSILQAIAPFFVLKCMYCMFPQMWPPTSNRPPSVLKCMHVHAFTHVASYKQQAPQVCSNARIIMFLHMWPPTSNRPPSVFMHVCVSCLPPLGMHGRDDTHLGSGFQTHAPPDARFRLTKKRYALATQAYVLIGLVYRSKCFT